MKKYIKVILIIIGIFILCIGLDVVSVITLNKPIFAIKENNDSVNIVYRGLLYDTYDCVEYNESQIKIKGSKYTCPLVENNKVVNIKDATKDINDFTCLEALEQFYEDDNFIYQFGCIKSESVIVKYDDGTEENVVSALEKGNIKITDLDKYNISYYKMEK